MTRATPTTATRPHAVFIDGQAGTVGLSIRKRLASMAGFSVIDLPDPLRKDSEARREAMARADVVVLCLPDDAAVEAVAMINALGDKGPRILDASTAHRVDPQWVYGFAELSPDHSDLIAAATRVTNPGCYAVAAIALLRPLVDAGLVPADFPITITGVSGYSGGGRPLITAMEAGDAPPFKLYALGLEHKHVPEIQTVAGLRRRPILLPGVGDYRQGMLVSIPLHLSELPGAPDAADLRAALRVRYADTDRVTVVNDQPAELEPETLNDTDRLELRVLAASDHGHAVLLARLDNLGMGAAGTAVHNISLMCGG